MAILVEAWRVELGHAAPPSAAELEILSAAERARHAAFLVAEPGRRFATTRLVLRRLLGHRLGCDPREVQIQVDPFGKPSLAGGARPFFNVSHCSSAALVALCEAAPVGVDVEDDALHDAPDGLRSSVCAPAESVWLDAHRAEAADALARLWCRKEAVLKAWGVGLARPMSRIDLGVPDARSGHAGLDDGRIVHWRDLALPVAERGAIAVLAPSSATFDATLRAWVR